MGGPGSGRRWHDDPKDTTDDMRQIDVRYWKREGLLTPGCRFTRHWTRMGEVTGVVEVEVQDDRVILVNRHRREDQMCEEPSYPIYLDWTRCHLGGERPWFLCPRCSRRVAVLYGGERFRCRHCHDLAYPCQNETDMDRAARRANRIRRRLQWPPGVLNGHGPKPKGMHWRTYWRPVEEHDDHAQQVLGGLVVQLRLDRP